MKFFPLAKVSVAKVSCSKVHYLFLLAKEEVTEGSNYVKCETSGMIVSSKVCTSFIVEKENCFRIVGLLRVEIPWNSAKKYDVFLRRTTYSIELSIE